MSTGPVADTPRLYRRADGRVLAGVARGLADHLGVEVTVVRVVFVLLTFFGGAGVLTYALFWIFTPQDPRGVETPADREQAWTTLLALGSLGLGGLLLLNALGLSLDLTWLLPLMVTLVGLGLVWRQADEASRARWLEATAGRRGAGLLRLGAGGALIVLGLGAILFGPADLDGTRGGVVAALVVSLGLALVSAPWWVRMGRDLTAERAARIREQERAEVAAHVHDSVLHTLTLIQRNAEDPRQVVRLARAQERELRGWLYRPRTDATVAASLERVAADVEDDHGVTIDVVVVGDCPLDERLAALRDATREALVNAAKYAGQSAISLYAEVEPAQVTVFVRDRGPGFDPAAVPADRLGLRESVVGRMERNAGAATVRSAAGEGTEVMLTMPRNGKAAT